MPTTRKPMYWIVVTAFLALTAGCFASKQTQVPATSPVPPAFAKASPAQSSSTQALPPDNQTVTEQPNCETSQTQTAINTCTKLSAEVADKRLNQIYQQLGAQLKDSQQKKLLTEAELAWIKFRDANCKFEESRFAGGTVASSVYSKCIEQETKQRTNKLEDYLSTR